MNLPGFTAEHSLHRTEEHFHTGVSDTSRALNAEVIPQLMCLLHGSSLTCMEGDGEFGWGGGAGGGAGPINPGHEGESYEACRARCLRKSGAAQRICLADC